jgi:hypothetical protein
MTTLMAERGRGPGDDNRQEALFGGEALAPSRPPWAPAPPAREPEAASPAVAAPETVVADYLRAPRTAGAPLDGPTLDDAMSRAWEGLAAGLPAACPVCHGEVMPSLGGPLRGRCSSCDTTID